MPTQLSNRVESSSSWGSSFAPSSMTARARCSGWVGILAATSAGMKSKDFGFIGPFWSAMQNFASPSAFWPIWLISLKPFSARGLSLATIQQALSTTAWSQTISIGSLEASLAPKASLS